MELVRFGVSIEENLLEELDKLANKLKFPNRSQAIRHLIKSQTLEHKIENNKKVVAGTIVLVYDHHKRELNQKLIKVQHDFTGMILCSQHVHLNHENCLETITVKGKASEISKLADLLISIKGVIQGKLVITDIE